MIIRDANDRAALGMTGLKDAFSARLKPCPDTNHMREVGTSGLVGRLFRLNSTGFPFIKKGGARLTLARNPKRSLSRHTQMRRTAVCYPSGALCLLSLSVLVCSYAAYVGQDLLSWYEFESFAGELPSGDILWTFVMPSYGTLLVFVKRF